MRKATRISLALGTSAALLTLSALPASAAEEDPISLFDSQATIAVAATGTLSMTVAEGGISDITLKPRAESGFLVPTVTVVDERSWTTGWTSTVKMTEFVAVNEDGTPVVEGQPRFGDPIVPQDLEYLVDETLLAQTGDVEDATIGSPSIAALNKEQDAVEVVMPHGDNTATWTPTVSFTVPANALLGKYTATLTHSLY